MMVLVYDRSLKFPYLLKNTSFFRRRQSVAVIHFSVLKTSSVRFNFFVSSQGHGSGSCW